MKIGKVLLKRKVLGPAGIIATLLLLFTFMDGFVSAVDQRLITAPLNPAYLEYMENLRTGNLVTTTEKGYPLGAIPPLFVLPPESEGTLPNFPPASYQPYFDLRAVNGLTGIRDQGACGSCWTFATFASLESYHKFKKGLTMDFSEWHLAKNHLWDNSPCDGGNHLMSTAYLSRWGGPRNESELPYPYNVPVQATTFHVQKVWWLPGRANFTANNTIKGALLTNGAVYMAFYWVDAYFNSTNNCYYNGVDTSENHAVAIVGWNDSYPRTNFTEPLPPNNGAFIVRNSWGTGWGENGYFYISYYDRSLKAYAQFYNAEALNSHKSQYSHDPLGCNNFVGYLINNKPVHYAWGANIYTARSGNTKIKSVGGYTSTPNCKYQIWIYDNIKAGKPTSGTLIKTVSGTIAQGGYNTINFGAAVANVTAGKKFSVVMKVTNPAIYNYPYPIGFEKYIPGSTSKANALSGQSYLSYDGKNWSDITSWNDYWKRSNLCIRAFAGN